MYLLLFQFLHYKTKPGIKNDSINRTTELRILWEAETH